jgi:hypothetical protein
LKMYDYVNYEIDILNRYARGEKYGYWKYKKRFWIR